MSGLQLAIGKDEISQWSHVTDSRMYAHSNSPTTLASAPISLTHFFFESPKNITCTPSQIKLLGTVKAKEIVLRE